MTIEMEWIFSGIGTSILSGIAGLFIGGGIGYKIGIRNTIRQKQNAHDNSSQSQTGQIINHGNK
jgi:hypothetical protein